MLVVKNLFDHVGPHDGLRVWVEPVGLTRNLAEWCEVDFVLTEVAPPLALWEWVQENPAQYGIFRARYHDYLFASHELLPVLDRLIRAGSETNVTLLHQGADPARNTATALAGFLDVLSASSHPIA